MVRRGPSPPQLDAALDRLEPGDTLLCYALDRLSRSQVDTAILVDRIESAGASLALVTEDFEKSATGTFLRGAKAFAAELEREKIAERTQRGRNARVASGKPLVSLQSRPTATTGTATNPATCSTLRPRRSCAWILEWALAGVPLRGIGTRLAERGIPSPAGQPRWAVPPRFARFCRRPTYTGTGVAYRDAAREPPTGGPIRCGKRPPTSRFCCPASRRPSSLPKSRRRFWPGWPANQAQAARNNHNPEATLLRAGFVRVRPLWLDDGCLSFVTGQPGVRSRNTAAIPELVVLHGCPTPVIGSQHP